MDNKRNPKQPPPIPDTFENQPTDEGKESPSRQDGTDRKDSK